MAPCDDTGYDVVIIGAGIGGLVSGCYLAKAGMKVLIAEQHTKPGGYCTSFRRKEFIFDSAAHSFGGYQQGPVRQVLNDLGLSSKLVIRQFDPSDVVVTPFHRISFHADVNSTLRTLQQCFPREHDTLQKFFNVLSEPPPDFLLRMRRWTFKEFLDEFFVDERLKNIFAIPVFGNGGVPPQFMTAYLGTRLIRETLLDGGYYPLGGIQSLSDALAARFKDLGGSLLLSSTVRKIVVKDAAVCGIISDNEGFIPSKYVVSNGDAVQTFFHLLDPHHIPADFQDTITHCIPSLSMYVLYLGLKDYRSDWPQQRVNIWQAHDVDLTAVYQRLRKGLIDAVDTYIVHYRPDSRTITAFFLAPYMVKSYWDARKQPVLESFIARIERDQAPGLSENIAHQEAATPHTLSRYTLNYQGAAYGWENRPSQFADYTFRKPHFLRGLFLVGHWTTVGHGIPGVAHIGRETAGMVIKSWRDSR